MLVTQDPKRTLDLSDERAAWVRRYHYQRIELPQMSLELAFYTAIAS